MIDKAEKGVPAFETERFKPAAVAQARAVYRILEPGDADVDVPDFISDAVQVAVEATADRYGVRLWLDVDGSGDGEVGGLSVAAIAGLFERAGGHGVEVEPARDLAGLISGVLTHPDTPERVYDKLTDALVEMHDATDVYDDPRAVAALLNYHAKQHEEEGGE